MLKKTAILLLVVALLAGGLVGYALFRSSLQVVGKDLQTCPAQQDTALFEKLRSSLERSGLEGTVFRTPTLGDPSNYAYYVYTLRVKNPGLLTAEMVELQLSPLSDDILFYTDTAEVILKPGETRDLKCVLFTEGAPHAVRDFYITYYLWGHPYEVKFTYDDIR